MVQISVGGSETSIRTLNDIFQQKLLQVEQQTNSVKFDGVKLLTGEFGSDPTIKSKYNTKIVDVRKMGAGSGTLFKGEGTRAVKIIDIQNVYNIKAGDTISFHDVNFNMVQNKELVTSESDILIGTSEEQTVSNIATALKNHPSEILRIYNVTTRNKQVIITQRSASTSNIPLIINSKYGGFCDNSDPSHYSFSFQTNPTVGSKLTISGVTFEIVAKGKAGNDHTKVERKNNKWDTSEALYNTIKNYPVIKDLIDQKMLYLGSNGNGLSLGSVFNKDILGFKAGFNYGALKNNIVITSRATTHGYKIKFTQPSINGDIIRFLKPDGLTTKNFVLIPLNIDEIRKSVHNAFLNYPPIFDGLISQEDFFIYSQKGEVVIYSNYDMQLRYIPVGANQAVKISRIGISMRDVFGSKPAINVSTLRNIEDFVNKPKVNVKVMAQATSGAVAGDGLAEKLYRQVKGDVSLPTIAADGDIATVLHVDIAGRIFQSVVWQGNGTNLNNRELVFTEPSTGETFSINTKDLNSNITTLQSTIDTLAKPIERLLSSTEFTQIRDLEIDNSSKEIMDNNGKVIGNLDGMTVSLNWDFPSNCVNSYISP